MRIVDDFSEGPAFEILEPTAPAVPFVFNAPHSGTTYPRDLLQRTKLDRLTLRRSEDTFVDELFDGVVRKGAPLMRAHFPRVYLDLNREDNELDPAMFSGPLKAPVNADSARVAGGLGVIARIVGERQDIYASLLPPAEAERRLDTYYRPYHRALASRIDATVNAFGTCVLVDCHSMPSGAVKFLDEKATARPDIILGDRFGTSCSPLLTDELSRLLRRRGFVVGRNRPYAGGFITEKYGTPPRVHAIQMEINRALYMNEATFARSDGFIDLQEALDEVCAELIQWFAAVHLDTGWSMAAE
ncbi:N-formylglutamate amidohydrolase [Acuticoccus mangrovi]|uniref:N-formylglutamate amidohydrolase n=1 Tax=Acuticoccus mangrovi TaxID=2796142 RepID=A0A934MM25_9HYPH|nr:N-formylglutamate amidohydrolase [Acuticoccus mangrovi]MBJ3776894.1 N-formylglutamate amidohydrolase [Acuticoccus mangrovi]